MTAQHFFGTPDQQKVTRRAADAWTLLKDDPRFSTHGRIVGTNGYVTTDLSLHVALTRLQGVGASEGLPDRDVAEREAALQELGFKTDTYYQWENGPESIGLCDAWLASHSLPDDVELLRIGPDTPLARLEEVAELVASVDMMLPMENFVRGQAVDSVYVAALDQNGTPVAHASATQAFHPDAPNGKEAHWGMLATAHHRRGEGMALYLGALALTKMHSEYGFTDFATGIRAGNVPSEKLCARLGFASRGRSIVLSIDPAMIEGDQITK
jgi:hypothetical protein